MGKMSRDDAPCKCNGTGFIRDPIIGNLICDCTFRKAGLGINKEWVSNANVEMDYLKSELKKACGYLRQAKIKWGVHTTNSDVDVFLEKWGKE